MTREDPHDRCRSSSPLNEEVFPYHFIIVVVVMIWRVMIGLCTTTTAHCLAALGMPPCPKLQLGYTIRPNHLPLPKVHSTLGRSSNQPTNQFIIKDFLLIRIICLQHQKMDALNILLHII